MSKSNDPVPGPQLVTALARGLDILRCFDRSGLELTVSELARRVGLNQPTTWRLCNTLIAGDYLVRSGNGAALRVGAHALTLGHAAIRNLDLPAIVMPHMKQLTLRIRGSSSLSLRSNGNMISVAQSDGDFVVANQPVGWRVSLTSVPSGLAVLAVLPKNDLDQAMQAIAAREPAAWPRRRERIERAIAGYARDGYVMLDDMADGQYAATAVPLIEPMSDPDNSGTVRYWGMSCGGVRARWDADHLAAAAAQLVALKRLLQPALFSRGV